MTPLLNESPHLVAHLKIHAHACKELRHGADESRTAELVEIIRNCESAYPLFRSFRLMTPECKGINNILASYPKAD